MCGNLTPLMNYISILTFSRIEEKTTTEHIADWAELIKCQMSSILFQNSEIFNIFTITVVFFDNTLINLINQVFYFDIP